MCSMCIYVSVCVRECVCALVLVCVCVCVSACALVFVKIYHEKIKQRIKQANE